MVLGLGDRAGGWKRGGVEGGFRGVGGMNENYVMDGQKDNDVISTAYRCVLRRPILIVSGAFGQIRRKGGWGGTDGGGRRGRGGKGLGFLKKYI